MQEENKASQEQIRVLSSKLEEKIKEVNLKINKKAVAVYFM